MPGVKPWPRAAPPKFKVGQWIFYAHVEHKLDKTTPIECSIEMMQITEVRDLWSSYDYWCGPHVIWPERMFGSLEEAMEFIRQEMKKNRLKILVEHGAAI